MREEKRFNKELFFAALADRTRLRLINLMGNDELCVCFLVETIGTNQPKVSRHLAYLKKAGLVKVRRTGKWAHYQLVAPNDEQAARVFAQIREWISGDPEMRLDIKRLAKMCCAPAQQQPISIQGAPRPKSLAA
jgi:ArsR family transcriptional regulator